LQKDTAKTRHFGKITAFDENHGFRDFRDYLLSLSINPINRINFKQFYSTEFCLLIVSKTLKLRKINLINQINRLMFNRLIQLIDLSRSIYF